MEFFYIFLQGECRRPTELQSGTFLDIVEAEAKRYCENVNIFYTKPVYGPKIRTYSSN